MEDLYKYLTAHSSQVLLALSCALLICVVWLVVQSVEIRRVRRRWRELLDGVRGETIERMLNDHLKQRVELENELSKIENRLQSLESRMAHAKRYIGLVRYDAFEDVGGQQSFALALYDEQGNGVVLSSLIGRADCRVYCKSIAGGKAGRELTAEEQAAIEEAAKVRVGMKTSV